MLSHTPLERFRGVFAGIETGFKNSNAKFWARSMRSRLPAGSLDLRVSSPLILRITRTTSVKVPCASCPSDSCSVFLQSHASGSARVRAPPVGSSQRGTLQFEPGAAYVFPSRKASGVPIAFRTGVGSALDARRSPDSTHAGRSDSWASNPKIIDRTIAGTPRFGEVAFLYKRFGPTRLSPLPQSAPDSVPPRP